MNFLLCAIAKCENKYILEWVQWHLKLGFNKIVIYDNNDPEGERISDTIGNLVGVEIVDWRGRKQASCETQVAAYNDCYKKHLDVDWIFFLDIDEFLEFKEGVSLKSFFMNVWTKNANVIKFHWKCYGDSGYIDEQNGLVTETYKELCTDRNTNLNTKSAYRGGLENLKILNVHYCNDVGKIYYQSGAVCKNPCSTTDNNINYDNGWVRHYVTKSLEEFVKIKFARRNPGTSKTRLNSSFYFKYNKRTPEKEQKLKDLIMLYDNNVKVTPDNNVKVTPDNTPKEKPQNTNWWERMEPVKKPSVYDLQNKKSDRQNTLVDSGENYPFGVSVCISAWKTAEYIEECLDSVANQTWFKDHDNWEILLGIDACEETLAKVNEIMHKYKNLRVMMMNENVGTYVTCNTIMKESKYEWLIRFDSDDVMLPNMVETIMKEKGDAEFINCNSYSNIDNIEKISNCSDGQITIKHNIFVTFGGFQNWRCSADTELKTRLSAQIKQKFIQTPLFFYRKNNSNSLTKVKTTNFGSSYRNEKREYIQTKSKNIPKINLATTTFFTIGEINIAGKSYNNEQTIISLTSWKQRIQIAHKAISSLLQCCKKSHIVLVLSEEEFPQKEKSLPKQIIDLANSKKIEIIWTYDNIKAFKKVIPTMEKYKNVPIVSADDDLIYTRDYASELYESFKKNKDVFSVSYRHSKMVTNCGAATLYNPKYYNLIKSSFNKKYIEYHEDDMFMQYVVEKNTLKQLFISDLFPCKSFIQNDEYALNKTYKNNKTPSERKQYYFSEYDKIVKAKIVVNITTWTKRDWCLYPMLKNLKQQTLYPDRIVLWLSEEEYDKDKLPQSIQKCIDEKLLTDVMWVKQNTKGHKRYDCFKYFNDCYNVLLDDDILYKPTFIEELVNETKKHQNCITVYSSYSVEYNGVHITRGQFIKEPSHKNNFIAGRCCFPPYTFPFDAYENEEFRNEYVLNCDESWYRPFFIKHDIKINVMHQWDNSHYPIIGGSQDECLWNLNGKVMQNGMRDKERNFYNAIKITHTESICKQIWEKMDIDNYVIIKN